MIRKARQNKTSNRDPFPRQIISTIQGSMTLRFVATADIAEGVISTADILNSVVWGTGTTTQYRIFNSVRVRRIRIHGMATSSLGYKICSLELYNNNAKSAVFQDFCIGIAQPGYVDARPEKGTTGAMWQTTGFTETNAFMYVTIPQNGILDIDIDYALPESQTGTGVTTTATSTANVTYMRTLDFSGGTKVLQGIAPWTNIA